MHGPAKTGSVRFSTFQQSETGDSVPIQYWLSGQGGRFQVTCRLLHCGDNVCKRLLSWL